MKLITLGNITLENTTISGLKVYLDDDERIVFLPALWLIHLYSTLSVWKWKQTGYINRTGRRTCKKAKAVKAGYEPEEITLNTANAYASGVFEFLKYLNQCVGGQQHISVHDTQLIDSVKVNYYLNNILPQKVKSSSTLNVHYAALKCYFGFLFCENLGIKGELNFMIYPKTVQMMAEKCDRQKKTKYISRENRTILLQNCENERDRLILRMGYEVGLRTSENLGLVLSHHRAKQKNNDGLLTLFEELDKFPNKNRFQFFLNGKFTKRGRSRNIYFDRELLFSMRKYYQTERKRIVQESGIDSPTLFVKNDNDGKGHPIAHNHASKLFNELKKHCPYMISEQSYHDLRHSFATELYYEELLDQDGKETRSQQAALLTVQLRLGHKSEKSTAIYIRLCLEMKILEGLNK